MHGRRKKDVVELSPEEKEKQKLQVNTAKALFTKMLSQRQAKVYNQQALEMTAKALQFHPEFPTLWGYRRELLQSGKVDGELWQLLKVEMKLLEGALRKTQKVYSIWFHRHWVVGQLFELCGVTTAKAQALLDTELGLCRTLLDVDERNFHCWNHRAHVLCLMRRHLEARAAALPQAGAEAGGGGEAAAAGEVAAAVAPAAAAAGGGDAGAGGMPTPPAGPDAAGGPQPGPSSAVAAPQAGADDGAGARGPTPGEGTPAPGADGGAGGAGGDGGAGGASTEAAQAQVGPDLAAGASVPAAPAEAPGDAAAQAAPAPPASSAAAAAAPAQEARAVPTSIEDLVALDLKLSTELINKNFSNYSAWHLRTLLQQAPPGSETAERLMQSSPVDVAKELEWVQQGIYTEPNDQSVWLYHHWLTILSRGCEQPRITYCAVLGGELFAFFSRPVCAHGAVSVQVDGLATVTGRLEPLGRCSKAHLRTRQLDRTRRWAVAWRFLPSEGAAVAGLSTAASISWKASVEVLGTSEDGVPLTAVQCLEHTGAPVACDGEEQASTSPALAALLLPDAGAERGELLRGELARVDELLELEPDCRWALLARGRLAIAASAGSPADEVEAQERAVAEGYDRISALDPLRRGFYSEARAASLMRLRIMSWLASGNGLCEKLDLSSLSLRHLAPTATIASFGVRVLSVEGNALQELGPILLLSSLQELNASSNRLVGDVAEAFVLRRLRRLNLQGNRMALKGSAVELPPDLHEVDLSDNPPVLSAGEAASAQEQDVSKALLDLLLAGESKEVRGTWQLAWSLADKVCRLSRPAM